MSLWRAERLKKKEENRTKGSLDEPIRILHYR